MASYREGTRPWPFSTMQSKTWTEAFENAMRHKLFFLVQVGSGYTIRSREGKKGMLRQWEGHTLQARLYLLSTAFSRRCPSLKRFQTSDSAVLHVVYWTPLSWWLVAVCNNFLQAGQIPRWQHFNNYSTHINYAPTTTGKKKKKEHMY
jgi:hypothetical protein